MGLCRTRTRRPRTGLGPLTHRSDRKVPTLPSLLLLLLLRRAIGHRSTLPQLLDSNINNNHYNNNNRKTTTLIPAAHLGSVCRSGAISMNNKDDPFASVRIEIGYTLTQIPIAQPKVTTSELNRIGKNHTLRVSQQLHRTAYKGTQFRRPDIQRTSVLSCKDAPDRKADSQPMSLCCALRPRVPVSAFDKWHNHHASSSGLISSTLMANVTANCIVGPSAFQHLMRARDSPKQKHIYTPVTL